MGWWSSVGYDGPPNKTSQFFEFDLAFLIFSPKKNQRTNFGKRILFRWGLNVRKINDQGGVVFILKTSALSGMKHTRT
jgi:hypothetical protein